MEFPQDIQYTIREFSRPLLPFVTEFKRTIRKLAHGPDMDLLYDDIKKKLYTAEGEQVIEAFIAYAAAVAATNRAMSLLPKQGEPDWSYYVRSVAKNTTIQTESFQNLRSLVYGEKHLIRFERWIMYNSDEE
jgi:hypothetical protein